MNILPLTYLGNVQYFSKLCFDDCVIDVHEHYVKQSYRNRCNILTANGSTPLIVPVVHPNNFNKPTIDQVRIDYSKRWQHQHWHSLESGYRNSPYFDFYEDEFRPFFNQRQYELLAQWNIDLLRTVLRLLGSDKEIVLSNEYIEPRLEDADYRDSISPKPRLHSVDVSFHAQPYYQVFSDTMAFAPNLSIIDLLFCEGPHALTVLKESVVK